MLLDSTGPCIIHQSSIHPAPLSRSLSHADLSPPRDWCSCSYFNRENNAIWHEFNGATSSLPYKNLPSVYPVPHQLLLLFFDSLSSSWVSIAPCLYTISIFLSVSLKLLPLCPESLTTDILSQILLPWNWPMYFRINILQQHLWPLLLDASNALFLQLWKENRANCPLRRCSKV